MKNNQIIKLYILAELILPFMISYTIARQYQNNALIILLYLPISNTSAPLLHRLFENKKVAREFIDIYNSTIPDIGITESSGRYFRTLHSSTQENAHEIFSLLKSKKSNARKSYRIFCKIRRNIAAINTFRLFPASLMLKSNIAVLFFITAVISISAPEFTVKNSKHSAIKSSVICFFTLPQRATVMFDAYLRSALKPLAKIKIVRRYIEKSQYSRHHTQAILYAATYFWAFFLSFLLIFSHTDVISLAGIIFSLAPVYYMCAEEKHISAAT